MKRWPDSVVVKWYITEDLRSYALKIRDDYIDGKFKLAAPSLLPFEVLNAARYARKDISPTILTNIAQSLAFYGVRLHNLQGDYCKETVETALENEISIDDASYIALAKQLKTIMYTSDQKLNSQLEQERQSMCKTYKRLRQRE